MDRQRKITQRDTGMTERRYEYAPLPANGTLTVGGSEQARYERDSAAMQQAKQQLDLAGQYPGRDRSQPRNKD